MIQKRYKNDTKTIQKPPKNKIKTKQKRSVFCFGFNKNKV